MILHEKTAWAAADSVVSTVETPTDAETLCGPFGTGVGLSAAVDPDSAPWPSGYPSWTVSPSDHASLTSTIGSTNSFSADTVGSYTVTAACGTSKKAVCIKEVGIASISGPNSKVSTRQEVPVAPEAWGTTETIYAPPYANVQLTAALAPASASMTDDIKDAISWSQSGYFSGTIEADESNPLSATFYSHSTGDYVITVSCGSSQETLCSIMARLATQPFFACVLLSNARRLLDPRWELMNRNGINSTNFPERRDCFLRAQSS